jgi:hypothetical protein
LDADENGD